MGAGYTSASPLTDPGNSSSYILEGQARDPNDMQDALFRVVTTDYFQTIGARLREGRFFTAADGPNGLPVAIINETFANRHFRGASAVGRRLQMGRLGPEYPWYTVIGVVRRSASAASASVSSPPCTSIIHRQSMRGRFPAHWLSDPLVIQRLWLLQRARPSGQSTKTSRSPAFRPWKP